MLAAIAEARRGRRRVRLPRRRRERLAEGALPPAGLRRARQLHEVLPSGRRVSAALAVRALEKRYGPTIALAGVDLEVARASSSACSARTAPASRRWSRSPAASSDPLAAGPRSAASALARWRPGGSFGYLAELFRFPGWYSADELLELHQRLSGSRAARPSGGAARARRPRRRARPPRRGDVEGHAAAARDRAGAGRRAPLLLLDEPTSALDPVGRRTVRQLLEELRSRGVVGAAELAPAERGRARLRPRRDPAARRARRRRPPADLAARAASRSRPTRGRVRGGTRDDVPASSPSWSRPGAVYGVRVLTSSSRRSTSKRSEARRRERRCGHRRVRLREAVRRRCSWSSCC